jgi:hypothetical protein
MDGTLACDDRPIIYAPRTPLTGTSGTAGSPDSHIIGSPCTLREKYWPTYYAGVAHWLRARTFLVVLGH